MRGKEKKERERRKQWQGRQWREREREQQRGSGERRRGDEEEGVVLRLRPGGGPLLPPPLPLVEAAARRTPGGGRRKRSEKKNESFLKARKRKNLVAEPPGFSSLSSLLLSVSPPNPNPLFSLHACEELLSLFKVSFELLYDVFVSSTTLDGVLDERSTAHELNIFRLPSSSSIIIGKRLPVGPFRCFSPSLNASRFFLANGPFVHAMVIF